MKTKKWLKISLLFPLLWCGSCKKEKPLLFIGNFVKEEIELYQQATKERVESAFISSKMTSNELYKVADTHSYSIVDGKKYSFEKLTRNANQIFLRIGYQDFLPYLQIQEKNNLFSYDENLVEKQKELLVYNVYHALEEIRFLNAKADFYLLGITAFYAFEEPEQKLFSSFLYDINQALKSSIYDLNVRFLSFDGFQEEKEVRQEILRWIL